MPKATRVLAAAAILLAATAASATTWTVDDDGPADFSSIQAAINAASDGDEILVYPGRYRETLSFLQKAITVRSTDGPLNTLIFLDGETRIVRLDGESTLKGFTIRGGRAKVGAGIYVTNPTTPISPVIEGNIIENNTAALDGLSGLALGGGIEVETPTTPVITRNVIRGNRVEGDAQGLYAYGGAIDVGNEASATITDNVLADNTATDSGGAISIAASETAAATAITNNTISGNKAGEESNLTSYGGGILVDADARAVIRNNVLSGNSSANLGGGIYFFGNGLQTVTYESNDFHANTPDDCGGLPESKCTEGQFFLQPLYQEEAAGNYRLQSDSPLLDLGSSGADVPLVDADVWPRSVDSNLDGTAAADIGAYENQGEITRVRAADKTTFQWDGSSNPAVTFDVYRDPLSLLAPPPIGACWQAGLTATTVSDAELPALGQGFFYLVGGVDAVHGTLGRNSAGDERTPDIPCP